MANAIARGSATSPTVMPATRSLMSRSTEYPRPRASTSFGSGTGARVVIKFCYIHILLYMAGHPARQTRTASMGELHEFKAAFFRALAHPVRIRILELLVREDRNVQE